ncbi:lumazine synthase [Coemansia sp. RSA 1813]|nr:lumazine synthase [Coemansia sp. RSA 1646]KAJ1772005.1 lumazine synthase [Coemansia sp. RSA 1843]KAJ2089777.1 lumazine synthase [Coemansia sp. RSA 986]KAJ2210508.1 lumazine synthase [Coemansia sp. RSA 487]KAJ2569637.1 lumazine synthase [Coemansia sp. RSA 1813]
MAGGTDFEKGTKDPVHKLDGSKLKVLIVCARWNSEIVDELVSGAKASLLSCGVKEANIVVRDVSGSYELPGAALKLIRQSQQQSTNLVSDIVEDILTSASATATAAVTGSRASRSEEGVTKSGPFDAAICVGVLIKGSTMHFEYISEAVTHGIMRVGLDTGVPTVFGVLTCMTDEQALQRAGMGTGNNKGHNHGSDWGTAAVDMALLSL